MFKIIQISILLSVYLGSIINCNAQKSENKAKVLIALLQKNHVEPKSINDTFSQQLFQKFITNLDPRKDFFNQNDINSILNYQFDLDNQILSGSSEFLDSVTILFKNKLKESQTFVNARSVKAFNFAQPETISYTYKDNFFEFAKNQEKLNNWWDKNLKIQALDLAENNDTRDIILKKEKELRTKVCQKANRQINNILKYPSGFETYVEEVYLNAIANIFDPHSMYFSPNEKELFNENISTETMSFGIEYEENDKGQIEVVRLVPGGSAWKSNDIHKGDVLLEVIYSDSSKKELFNYSTEEVYQLFSAENAHTLTFKILKTNGSKIDVKLSKSKIKAEENNIKSYILKGKEKIGFISLPGFYTELENDVELGCANDMAKEITKLQQEGIAGLIVDLRYNGGGSLLEALDLAGIFIDEGPISIVEYPKKEVFTLKDRNRGTIYDGPLLIMVNGMSASASEIFSAALQDYHRALIVGSTTYGKSTGQNILPLDSTLFFTDNFDLYNDKKIGYTKVTTSKLYRITGKTHQQNGVIPDIKLCAISDGLTSNEKSNMFSISSKSIDKKTYYKPLDTLNINQLCLQSSKRIGNDIRFQKITMLNDSLINLYQTEEIIKKIDLDSYLSDREKNNNKWKMIDSLVIKPTTIYEVKNHKFDLDLIKIDEYNKELNEKAIKNIQEDIYIEESYQIMLDYITFENNKN